jgi:RNA polymerase sigma factor (sigma-70 family)
MSENCPAELLSDEIEQLLQEHWREIKSAAQRVLGPDSNQEALDEVRQAVRICIWRALQKGKRIHEWKAFIYDCAHKRALDRLKHIRRQAQHEIAFGTMRRDNDTPAEERVTTVPVDADCLDHVLMLLDEELARLPGKIQLTVLLRKAEGYTRAEVARVLNCSVSTVDHRLQQGLHRLRRNLLRRGVRLEPEHSD